MQNTNYKTRYLQIEYKCIINTKLNTTFNGSKECIHLQCIGIQVQT
jgi:hypothetical protein